MKASLTRLDAFYIISSGLVRIFVRHEDMIERDLHVCGPGNTSARWLF